MNKCGECGQPVDSELGCDLCITKPRDIGKWTEPGEHEDYHETQSDDWGSLPQADPPGSKGWAQRKALELLAGAVDLRPELDDKERRSLALLHLERIKDELAG